MPLKAPAASTVALAPAVRVWAASAPAAWGAAGATVTAMVWVALPVVLVAVTVTVARPSATPVRVRTEPVVDTVTAAVSLLVAL